MRQTWRWFGPKDTVSMHNIMQAGVEGVVSALHHVPTGQVWTPQEISRRQAKIARTASGGLSGLAWEVVESLPVSEEIKKQSGAWRDHIANYKTSLEHLAQAGLEVICYNFMPVLDWTRTDLRWPRPDGARCMRFDLVDFIAFEVFILERPAARDSFPKDMVAEAAVRFAKMDDAQRVALSQNIVCGLPGEAENFSLEDVRQHLAEYQAIPADKLRNHFVDFLTEVVPVAERLGMRLCCHPDDPPFDLLGLPRIMSTEDDYRAITQAVDSPANGITLCTGSLGARPDNDLPGIMKRLGDKVHFLHLRNVIRDGADMCGSFFESHHLEGDVDLVAVIAAVLDEEKRRKAAGRADWNIPMRPDHGQDILDDLNRDSHPGYPAIGRLKGLAELRGIITALSHPLHTS
jgi:mannonate dehydratase